MLYPEIVLELDRRPLIFATYKKLAGGDAGLTPKRNTFETPPPGAGLETVIWAMPAAAISLAVTCAVSGLPLTKVVASALPSHVTVAFGAKPEPVNVSEKAAPPAVALNGEKEIKDGTELPAGGTWVVGP